jgi:hypothetical protein
MSFGWVVGVVAAVLLGACGHAGAGKVVRVGESGITEGDIRHWVAVLTAEERPGPRGAMQLKNHVLEFLIRARWVEEAARRDRIVAGSAASSELLALVMYARRRALPAVPYGWDTELGRYVVSPAASDKDQMWLMHLSVLYGALQQRAMEHAEAAVPRERVVRYYREKRRRFLTREHRDVAIVEASSLSAMLKAKHALAAGVSPEVVARRYSEGSYDATGLKLHYTQGLGGTVLDRAIFSATPHVVVGPLRIYWYYVFEVLRVEPRRALGLAEVDGKIRRTLVKKGLVLRLVPSLARTWRSETICSTGYLVAGCAP